MTQIPKSESKNFSILCTFKRKLLSHLIKEGKHLHTVREQTFFLHQFEKYRAIQDP
jgi:hypothetical protein